MFLEQGDYPTIDQESMLVIFQLVQHSYKPVNNVLFPLGPQAMGIAIPFHEFGLLDH